MDLEQSGESTCIDGIEFRYYHLGQPGPIYCGTVLTNNPFKIKSYTNFIMIIFRSDFAQIKKRRGFNLQVFKITY